MVFGLAALLPGDLNPLRVQVFAFANSGFYLFKFFFFFFFLMKHLELSRKGLLISVSSHQSIAVLI